MTQLGRNACFARRTARRRTELAGNRIILFRALHVLEQHYATFARIVSLFLLVSLSNNRLTMSRSTCTSGCSRKNTTYRADARLSIMPGTKMDAGLNKRT